MTHRYLIVIEKVEGNYSAYAPDLPGCEATGLTSDAAKQNMLCAMGLHIQGLRKDNLSVPAPQSAAEYVTVEA